MHAVLRSTKTSFHVLLGGKICALLAGTPKEYLSYYALAAVPTCQLHYSCELGGSSRGWKPQGPAASFPQDSDCLWKMVLKICPCLLGVGAAAVASWFHRMKWSHGLAPTTRNPLITLLAEALMLVRPSRGVGEGRALKDVEHQSCLWCESFPN